MEAQDAERVVVAKPIPLRPSCSSLHSCPVRPSGSMSSSPPRSLSETAVTAIRPKTVRIKPAVGKRVPVAIISAQGEVSGTAGSFSPEKELNPEIKSSVVYKPLAKLVSSRTVQLLANMQENFDVGHHQYIVPQAPPRVEHAYESEQHLQRQLMSNIPKKLPSPKITQSESSQAASQNMDESHRSQSATVGDRPSFDGYNWRKYGQKQVKGSEYPRSYYKCTHPSCPVKKKVERSFDGQIAEIVYKGEHNHVKPQPPKRYASGQHEQGAGSDMSGQETGNMSWSTTHNVRSEGSERQMENKSNSRYPLNPSYPVISTTHSDSLLFGAFSTGAGISGEEGSRGIYAEDDEPKFKRRRNDNRPNEVGLLGQVQQDPHIVVQSSTDSEVVGDGFRWRKYGQKVVKGNPYPRSYYRCTNTKCNVRKHVERTVDDPRAFITTYEGKHNHEMPTIGNPNPAASDPDSAALSNKSKQ